MILHIRSSNRELLSLLNKNPDTDGGLYLKPLRNGHLVGHCRSPLYYTVFFQDTKHSYTSYESNQIDFKSYCSPQVLMSIVTKMFPHIIKDREEVLSSDISWLKKTFGEVDNEKCTLHIENVFIKSSWYRDGKFLLSRYIDGIKLEPRGDGRPFLYSLTLEADSVFKVINLLAVVSFLLSVTNDEDDFYIQNAQIEKYARVLTNIKEIPYFVYYLYIKRCCSRSPKVFNTVGKMLQEKFIENSGLQAEFTQNDTHTDRLIFCKEQVNHEVPLLVYGSGEFRLERYCAKSRKAPVFSYDVEDYSELKQKFEKRYSFDWKFSTNLKDVPTDTPMDVICSEVMEHNDPKKFAKEMKHLLSNYNVNKLVLTTPNVEFNKFYDIKEGESRHDDHEFEFTYKEFIQWVMELDVLKEYTIQFNKIGDCIDGHCVTSGVVIEKKK